MKKLRSINTFIEGDKIQGFYLCVEKQLKRKRDGDVFISLILRDITGIISAKVWNNVKVLNDKFDSGNAVAVSGVVEKFLERSEQWTPETNRTMVRINVYRSAL